LETLGRRVRVTFEDAVEEGLAEDVDADGGLVLRRSDGSRVTIAAGDVTLKLIGVLRDESRSLR
jgi:biotin-(acetyl-CoA carboxylase) ligase